MFELVRECLKDDSAEAWGDLWQLFRQIAIPSARWQLKAQGFCEADVEDVVMETILSLVEDSHRRLKTFRGNSQVELCAWIRRIVRNHARNWVIRIRYTTLDLRPIELESIEVFARSSELDVDLFLAELADDSGVDCFHLTTRERRRLRILAGVEPASSEVSERTIRHWKQALVNRVEHLV